MSMENNTTEGNENEAQQEQPPVVTEADVEKYLVDGGEQREDSEESPVGKEESTEGREDAAEYDTMLNGLEEHVLSRFPDAKSIEDVSPDDIRGEIKINPGLKDQVEFVIGEILKGAGEGKDLAETRSRFSSITAEEE